MHHTNIKLFFNAQNYIKIITKKPTHSKSSMTFYRNSIKNHHNHNDNRKEQTIKHNCNVCIIYASSFPTKIKQKRKTTFFKATKTLFSIPIVSYMKSVPCHAIYLFFCQWTSATAGTQFHSGEKEEYKFKDKTLKMMCTNLN